jgi:hypothetical protein
LPAAAPDNGFESKAPAAFALRRDWAPRFRRDRISRFRSDAAQADYLNFVGISVKH